VFQARPALYWTGYALWVMLAVPFSSWQQGSFHTALAYVLSEYMMLIVVAGLTVTWKDCRVLMYSMAASGVISILETRIFRAPAQAARLSLEFGMVANPNDIACHLILLLPFVFWLMLDKHWLVTRLAAGGVLGLGVISVLSTGSRGAILALLSVALLYFWRASALQRVAFLILAPPVIMLSIMATPGSALERAQALFDRVSGDAGQSANIRFSVLRKSAEYALRSPLFGVGPGQFANYEGRNDAVYNDGRGYYLETHNSFMQVASECGLPAMALFVAGLVASFRLLNKSYLKARGRPECRGIRDVAFCTMLGLVGFAVASTFLNFAYFFYQPAIVGMAIAISRAAEGEFAKGGSEGSTAAAGQHTLPVRA
jgi:O-antigen ligase